MAELTLKAILKTLSLGTLEHYGKHFSITVTLVKDTFEFVVVRERDRQIIETVNVETPFTGTIYDAYERARVTSRELKSKYIYDYDNDLQLL